MAKTRCTRADACAGNIRFRATGPAGWPHTCSCKMCQRHSGALTVAWVEFPRDRVTWTGPGGAPATWRSSERSSRAFCPTCGSTLGRSTMRRWWRWSWAAFDATNRKALAPEGHSYVSGRPKWWHVVIGDKPAG